MSLAPAPVAERPFPHVVRDDFLEPDLYRALAESFPDCPPGSGPTGYGCFWGDPEFDALIEASPAWRTLFERFRSQQFVDHALAQFGETFAGECVHDLSNARYVPYRERREDKERAGIARIEHAPDELWIRFDILQGAVGYDRGPHLDHRRRAATLLIYFCDPLENDMAGGELVLHGRPGSDAVTLSPLPNRAIFFPCCNDSVHSVTPILRQRRRRNFVQITLSSSVDLWEPVRRGPRLRRIAARAARLLRQPFATKASQR